MKKLLFLCLSLLSLSAYATDYYCSPTGNSKAQATREDPVDFETGYRMLKGGDVLYCLGGVYNYSKNIKLDLSGSAANKICIFAVEGETPIFDFRGTPYGTRGFTNSGNYLYMKGLTLRYSGKNALLNNGSFCLFENLDVYGNGDTGVQMKQGHDNYIVNCDSHDNFDYQLGGTASADFGGNADGFADKQYTGGNNTYIGCRSWNNSDDGWDFYAHVSSPNYSTRIIDCICYNNGPKEYDMRNHARYETDKAWFDQFQGDGIDIKDDDGGKGHVSLQHYTNYGNGNGFKLGGNRTAHQVIVKRCLSVANTVKGFDQNNNLGKMWLYHNTACYNGTDYGFHNGESGGRLAIRNCVSFKSRSSNVLACEYVTQSNNSWNDGHSTAASDFLSIDYSDITAPRQADGSLPVSTLMHLAPGSWMIDAGVLVSECNEIRGAAPDLGYVESGEGDLVAVSGGLTDDFKAFEPKDPTEDIVQAEKDADAVRVAYVTIPGNEADVPVLQTLAATSDFKYTILDAAVSNNDYSKYDMLLISSVPSSGAAAMSKLKGYNLPTVLLKPWMFKSGVWGWGTAVNTTSLSVNVKTPDHPIFQGIDLTSNTLRLFGSCSHDAAVTGISSFTNCSDYTVLATPQSSTATTIADLQGAKMNGTTISQPYIMIGLSEYSMSTITTDCQQLILNACRYVMGREISSTIQALPDSISPVRTYNLSGIAQPASSTHRGLFIVRTGNKVQKVVR